MKKLTHKLEAMSRPSGLARIFLRASGNEKAEATANKVVFEHNIHYIVLTLSIRTYFFWALLHLTGDLKDYFLSDARLYWET